MLPKILLYENEFERQERLQYIVQYEHSSQDQMAKFEHNFQQLFLTLTNLNQTQFQHAVTVNKQLAENTQHLGEMRRRLAEDTKNIAQIRESITELEALSEERSFNTDKAVQNVDRRIDEIKEKIKLSKIAISDFEDSQTEIILSINKIGSQISEISKLEEGDKEQLERLQKELAIDGGKIKTLETKIVEKKKAPKADIDIENRKSVVMKKSVTPTLKPGTPTQKSEDDDQKIRRNAGDIPKNDETSKTTSEKPKLTKISQAPQTEEKAVVSQKPASSKNEPENATVNATKKTFSHAPMEPREPLRIWNGQHYLVFLHIGKAGGTSFDSMMSKGLASINKKAQYIGGKHFDWSFIEERFPADDVLTLFRDPASRAISHFHFMQSLSWTKGMKIRDQTISTFLQDPESMMANRGAWQDGQAAVSWLTGTHVGTSWVAKGKHATKDKNEMEAESLQIEHILGLAADRVENMFWFGILEDIDRSLELLQHQLNVTLPLALPRSNVGNAKAHAPIEDDVKDRLHALTPQDTWIYNFALSVFEARWNLYKTGEYVRPARPPFPQLNCRSTRFILSCKNEPYENLVYIDPQIPQNHKTLFQELL